MKVEEIVKATNGKLICGDMNKECKEFKRDSREIEKDDIYIALIGETTDGNNYYQEAVNKGAAFESNLYFRSCAEWQRYLCENVGRRT